MQEALAAPQICPVSTPNEHLGRRQGQHMTATTQKRSGEILNAEFFRAQAQTCRIQLMHTPLRERRYELQARADLYEEMADRLAES
jgi:hypothetical protein